MKKYIAGAIAGVALLANIVPALAAPAEKVEMCHVTDSFDVPQNEWTTVVGHRINVSGNALSAHQAHGDFVYAPTNDIDYGPVIFGLTWRQIAENLGLNLEGVDCSGFVADF